MKEKRINWNVHWTSRSIVRGLEEVAASIWGIHWGFECAQINPVWFQHHRRLCRQKYMMNIVVDCSQLIRTEVGLIASIYYPRNVIARVPCLHICLRVCTHRHRHGSFINNQQKQRQHWLSRIKKKAVQQTTDRRSSFSSPFLRSLRQIVCVNLTFLDLINWLHIYDIINMLLIYTRDFKWIYMECGCFESVWVVCFFFGHGRKW